jgi:FtsP/CotA-like multicopper oxidase with cupredoxin domain
LALLSTVSVTAGKTYRLRLINSGQLVYVNFAIAGHNLTIVQVEGTNVVPVTSSSIDIGPGQRYDVLVKADQPPGSYMMEVTVRERPIFDVKGMAIFQYTGAAVQLPTESPKHPLDTETSFGIAQDLSLKALDASKYPTASVLNATKVKRYVLVGTQNGTLLASMLRCVHAIIQDAHIALVPSFLAFQSIPSMVSCSSCAGPLTISLMCTVTIPPLAEPWTLLVAWVGQNPLQTPWNFL